MAVKSVLNPEAIVGRSAGNIGAAKNFISGGSPLGSSVVSSAANNIVGFQKSAAVKPVVPDINSILNTISSSIINNVNNSIQTVSNNLSKDTSSTIENIRNEFIKNIDRSIITNKTEMINYINKINVVNKKEFLEKVNQIINETNILNENIINTKEELVQYVDNIFKSQNVTNLITNIQNNFSDNIQRIEGKLNTIQIEKINQQVTQRDIQGVVEKKVENITIQSNALGEQISQTNKDLIQYVDNIFKTQDTTSIINNLQNNTFNKIEKIENQINQIKQTQKNQINEINQTQQTQQKTQLTGPQESRVSTLNIETVVKNITQSTQTVIQNIQKQASENLKNTIDNLSKNYQQKIKEVDNTKPVGILERFLKAYNTAIGFIQFFNNKKNMDRLKTSLSNLKTSFTETFEVAKLVRTVIIKIVKQLSSLPKVSPSGGGGINLDVDVPRGPLKSAAPKVSKRMGIGKMLGYGALGTGAVAAGGAVINALSDTDRVQPVSSESMIPQDTSDMFSVVVDRFSNAINSLIKQAEDGNKKQPSSTKSGGGSGAPMQSNDGGGGGTTPGGPADFSGSASAEKSFNYFVSQGYTKEQSAGIVGNLMQENRALDPRVANSIGHKGIAQWDPKDRYPKMAAFAKSKGLDPNTLEAQLQFVEEELKTGSGGLSKARLQGTKSLEEAALLVRKQYLRPGESEAMDANRIKFGQQVLSQYGGKSQLGKPGMVTTSGATPSVVAAPTPAATTQQIAQTVSRPAQQQAQVNVIPIDLSGNTQQQSGGGNVTPPQQQSKQGPSVPFLSPSNPENFLVLYSKMVYNIVDG